MALRNKMRGSGVSGPLDGHNANYPLGPQVNKEHVWIVTITKIT